MTNKKTTNQSSLFMSVAGCIEHANYLKSLGLIKESEQMLAWIDKQVKADK